MGVEVEPLAASLLALVHKLTGTMLVLFGVVLFPMPIPLGLILIALGLALLAPYFPPIQALVRSIRRKSPKVDEWMIRFKERCPRVIQITIEKTNPHLYDDAKKA